MGIKKLHSKSSASNTYKNPTSTFTMRNITRLLWRVPPNWSMFTENWSFETATSTRGDIESVEPSIMPLDLNESLAVQVPVKKKQQNQRNIEMISTYPALKFFGHTLTFELDFTPKIGHEHTYITALLIILPQYATVITFVRFSIHDVPPVMDTHITYMKHAKRIESIKRIISQLNKFHNIEHFRVKLVVDKKNLVQMKMMAGLRGLRFDKWTLAMVAIGEPIKDVQERSVIEKKP